MKSPVFALFKYNGKKPRRDIPSQNSRKNLKFTRLTVLAISVATTINAENRSTDLIRTFFTPCFSPDIAPRLRKTETKLISNRRMGIVWYKKARPARYKFSIVDNNNASWFFGFARENFIRKLGKFVLHLYQRPLNQCLHTISVFIFEQYH
jgi:hypothetical protein